MKKLVILFVSLFVLVIAAENVNAQNEATASAQASATIITPLVLEKEIDLSFGDIVSNSAEGGTVKIATDGTRTFTGGLSNFGTSLGTISAATFSVSGEQNANYSIQLPATDIILTLDGGGATMTIDDASFIHDAGSSPKIKANESFNVGATLSVEANQAAGEYIGSFDVTVAYE